jgi:hypothetical protein
MSSPESETEFEVSPDLLEQQREQESDRRKAERRASPGLAAYHPDGTDPRQASIRDISSSGVYLLTDERWEPGTVVPLTLQREGPLERNVNRRIAVQARAVRSGSDGIALSFVLPQGMDLRFWCSPLKTTAEQNQPEDVLHEFRLAEALAFLCRISPDGADAITELMRERLCNYRLASAIEIALRAQKMLAFSVGTDGMHAPPHVAMHVLETGSWADTDWIQQFWAGLLVSSCTADGRDDSNLRFVDIFAQLTPTHLRILEVACLRTHNAKMGLGWPSSNSLICAPEEISQIVGTRDLMKIERDLTHLAELGLLAQPLKSSSFAPLHNTNITPSNLGLQLFERCNGRPGWSLQNLK